MDIDTKQLSEVVLPRIKLIAKDERFYLVPNAEGYALSNYARLYKQAAEKSWHKVPMTYQREECYEVDGSIIPVHVLMKKKYIYIAAIFLRVTLKDGMLAGYLLLRTKKT